MAKRTRVNRSSHRPGGQGPSRSRKSSGDAAFDGSASSNPADEVVSDVAYNEVEVDEVAAAALAAATATDTDAAPTEPKRSRRRDRRRSTKQRTGDLDARVAAENVWVREDLRRIGIVSLVLLAALAACWVVFGMLDVLNLY